MRIILLLLIPFISGSLCLVIRRAVITRSLLAINAMVHSLLVISFWINRPAPVPDAWLGLDAPGLLILSIISALFLASTIYAIGYLRREHHQTTVDMEEGFLFVNNPESLFTGCLIFFLSTMSLVTVSCHLGLIWVAVEATTLSSAPLIFYHRHHRSLEATWKYLLICSVGIALALLGNFFLVVAGTEGPSGEVYLSLDYLLAHAKEMNPVLLQAAFVLCLIGYGTKMGLAPMQSWLPDAHSEAPSLASALLSGALLNCAMLALLRFHQVMNAAGLGAVSAELFIFLGLLSIIFAAVFIIRQTDYKRMLAYSSVEHMGILALGIGIGGAGLYGSMFHAVNHSLTKGLLFLASGNILHTYHSKNTAEVSGLLRRLPLTGVFWLAGGLAITGAPPFGPFMSELTILKGMLDTDRYGIAVLYLGGLVVIFMAMTAILLPMAFSKSQPLTHEEDRPPDQEPLWSVLPLYMLGVGILALGVYMPPWLADLLQQSASAIEGF